MLFQSSCATDFTNVSQAKMTRRWLNITFRYIDEVFQLNVLHKNGNYVDCMYHNKLKRMDTEDIVVCSTS